jgi:NTE family protein
MSMIFSGEIVKSVMASTCIPGIFIPVEIKGKLLVDGGIVENVPVTPLEEMGADYIIGVDLNAGLRPKKPENIIDIILNTFDFTLMTATKLQTKEVDVLITPDLSEFNMVDTDQIEDLIRKGYSAAKETLADIV